MRACICAFPPPLPPSLVPLPPLASCLSFIMHGAATLMHDVCTDNAAASHDAPHHDAHSWRGHAHNCGVCNACEATDREKEERRRVAEAEAAAAAAGKPSRSRSEIARENKEVRRVLSLLSLTRSSYRPQLLHRVPLWSARRISFFAQRRTKEIHCCDLLPFRNAREDA